MNKFIDKMKNTVFNWMQYVELEILTITGLGYFLFFIYLLSDAYEKDGLIQAYIFLLSSLLYLLTEIILIIIHLINRKFFQKRINFINSKLIKLIWLLGIIIVFCFNIYIIGFWIMLGTLCFVHFS